jgi:hypothetical protein
VQANFKLLCQTDVLKTKGKSPPNLKLEMMQVKNCVTDESPTELYVIQEAAQGCHSN